ncbi:MAG: ABC transporter permease subunit [Candidatus Eisenbacteria bacterium]|nr:ABC transporter permease subunit [Candidatus Eisenbacteria bacterium]
MRRITILAWKTLLELRRDPILLRMTFVMPVVMVVVLGSAISRDVRDLELAVVDYDRSPLSRQLAEKLRAASSFDIVSYPDDPRALRRRLDAGTVRVGVVIPPGAGADLARGEAPTLQLLLSGEDPTVASIGEVHARGVLADLVRETIGERMPLAPGPVGAGAWARGNPAGSVTAPGGATPVRNGPAPRSRVLFNPDLASKNYMVPVIAVVLLMMVTMMLTAMSIVKERETGTLEQLLVTPFRSHELILGKTLPFVAIGLLIFFASLFAAKLIYDFPMRGSLMLLLGFATLFILTMLGSGILVSTVARTQQQALFGTWFILVFFLLMSGFLFPIANMPRGMQLLTFLDPVRYFVTVVRGILMKGAGTNLLWPQAAALAGFGVATLAISSWRFRRVTGG